MMELAVRMVVSLAVVVGLLLLCVRLGGKKFKGRSGSPLQVLHRQSLSRSSGVALVSVGGRVLLLGTTDQQVQMLTELDPAKVEAPAETPEAPVTEAKVEAPAETPEAPVTEAPVVEAPVVAVPAAPAASAAPVAAVPDSLLGSMVGLVDEPTRWLQPKGARKGAAQRGLAAAATAAPAVTIPAVTIPAAPVAAAPVATPALAPVEEAQVASFAATLERELEAELQAAVAAPRLSPAQVLLQEEQDHSPLAGSLLSPDTWRLAARAVTRRAS